MNNMIKTALGGMSIIQPSNISELEEAIFNDKGEMNVLSCSELSRFTSEQIKFFCLQHGVYSIPTKELITELNGMIPNKDKAIEIGGGNGVYGRNLGIKSTDNYMQHEKNRGKFRNCLKAYEIAGQSPVKYGSDVLEIDGCEAVRKFKSETVFCAWVTHKYNPTMPHLEGNMFGVNYKWILDRKHTKKIILVGNINTHIKNPAVKDCSQVLDLSEIMYSRSTLPHLDRVFVWDC